MVFHDWETCAFDGAGFCLRFFDAIVVLLVVVGC
jgi:hypothetical protein